MTCGCGCAASNSSCCGSCSGVSAPTPYYNQAGNTQESHDTPVVQQILVAALSCSADFVMPACGQTAIIQFPGLAVLQVGSYLWNASFGYLRVTAFNSLTGEVKAINDCLPPNAAPGTLIPRCSLFTVTAPAVNNCLQCESDNEYIYVFPAGPPPMPNGDPFALDIVSVVGNVVTLGWHSVVVQP